MSPRGSAGPALRPCGSSSGASFGRAANGGIRISLPGFETAFLKHHGREVKITSRWKSRRAGVRALRYIFSLSDAIRGWRRHRILCPRPLRSRNRPRIGRGDRNIVRVRGAHTQKAMHAPSAEHARHHLAQFLTSFVNRQSKIVNRKLLARLVDGD